LAKKLSVSKSVSQHISLIGLSCSVNDYRLLYFTSKTLGLSFSKLDDLPLYNKKGKVGDFSFYHFLDDDKHLNYYLISNKKNGQIAISDFRNFDYFLLIDERITAGFQNKILNGLRSMPILQAAMAIPIKSLQDMDILMEDIELHLIEIKKSNKENDLLWTEKTLA